MSVPNIFATAAAGNIPASQIDANFAAVLPLTGGTIGGTGAASAITASGSLLKTANTNVTGLSLYQGLYPAVTSYDLNQSVLDIPAGSTAINISSVAGYVRNKSGGAGLNGNGVALFGVAIAAANNTATWGINTLSSDAEDRTTGAATGRIIVGHEADFNVMHTGTTVLGFTAGGNSLAAPAVSSAFTVNNLGTGIPWNSGFVSADGGADNGLALGALATSGTTVSSQKALFSYFDSGSTKRNLVLQAQGNGILVLSAASGGSHLSVAGYVRTQPVAVASLVAAATAGAGARAQVSDATQALTAGIGAVVAGGGANNVPVVSDGTNWRIG